MSDASVRIPEAAKDRLASIAVAEGLSLRAYLARLAETLLTPQERAERAAKALAALRERNGYAPTAAEQEHLDNELDRRRTRSTASRSSSGARFTPAAWPRSRRSAG